MAGWIHPDLAKIKTRPGGNCGAPACGLRVQTDAGVCVEREREGERKRERNTHTHTYTQQEWTVLKTYSV